MDPPLTEQEHRLLRTRIAGVLGRELQPTTLRLLAELEDCRVARVEVHLPCSSGDQAPAHGGRITRAVEHVH
eukprot:16442053-Heterocapsa_arctica.AAC.2